MTPASSLRVAVNGARYIYIAISSIDKMATSLLLANELLDLILSHIDFSSPEGRKTLIACCRSAQALFALSQKYLFRDTHLVYRPIQSESGVRLVENERSHGKAFLDLLNHSPHLAACVHNLTIELDTQHLKGSSDMTRVKTSSSKASFSLYAIAPRLRKLEKFSVNSSPRDIEWLHLERRTRSFFRSIVPRVQELDFRSFPGFTISAFSKCRDLRKLQISSLYWDISEQTIQSNPRGVQLQTLDLADGGPGPELSALWFSSPLSPLHIGQLRRLQLSAPFHEVETVDQILALCSSTLEDLDLRVDVYGKFKFTSAPGPPNLGSLHNLRNLTIRSSIQGYISYSLASKKDTVDHDILFIKSMLETLPASRPSLPVLQLDLMVTAVDVPEFETHLAKLPWSDLIRVLEDGPASSRTSTVKLSLQRSENGENIALKLLELMDIFDGNDDLKRLKEKGVLSYGILFN